MTDYEILCEISDTLHDVHTYLQGLEGKDRSEAEFIGASWTLVDGLISDLKDHIWSTGRFLPKDNRQSTMG